MSKISIVTPIYNEEENLIIYYDKINEIMSNIEQEKEYTYEILLVDNGSTDESRQIIRNLCKTDYHVKAIFNLRNYGFNNSVFHGLINSDGDCSILINADLQDPPDLIPQFIHEWENGFKCVLGIKEHSKEQLFMRIKRMFYYNVISALSEDEQILYHTGFGLYDRKFIDILKSLNEPTPYLKELVTSFSFDVKEIKYTQNKRERGKGVTNIYLLYDDAMTGLTKTSKKLMRIPIFLSAITGIIALFLAVQQFVLKVLHPEYYVSGMATLTVAMMLLSTVQLFFTGVLGEYILSINLKTRNRPSVFEIERINFERGIEK